MQTGFPISLLTRSIVRFCTTAGLLVGFFLGFLPKQIARTTPVRYAIPAGATSSSIARRFSGGMADTSVIRKPSLARKPKSALVPNSATCNNLLQDPGFEAYTPNPYWAEASTKYGTPLCELADCDVDQPRTGLVWGWFGGTVTDEIASLAQAVVIPAGTASLQFYFWINSVEVGSGVDDDFKAQIDSTTLFTADATQTGTYPGYTLVNVDASAFADGNSHTVRFIAETSGQIVNFFLDDVALCSNVSSPTPSTNHRLFLPLTIKEQASTAATPAAGH